MPKGRTILRRLAQSIAMLTIVGLGSSCVPAPEEPGPVDPGPLYGPLSLGTNGIWGDSRTVAASISSDGNIVVFNSSASNLVPGDDNDRSDTFLRDRRSGAVTRVAENTFGAPRITGNGRFVSFMSRSGDLVRHGVYDTLSGDTRTWSSTFSEMPAVVTEDGSSAVWGRGSSFGIFTTGCIVRDLNSGTEADCPHLGAGVGTVALEGVSRNARFVLYSWVDQSGGGTGGRKIWDRLNDTLSDAPSGLMPLGGDSIFISDNGRYLTGVGLEAGVPQTPRLFDRQTGSVLALPAPVPDGNTYPIDISSDGRTVALESLAANLDPIDTNSGEPDVYIWDTRSGGVRLAGRHLGDGSSLLHGSLACGRGPGQLLATGDGVCVLSGSPLVAEDTNGAADAYLVP